MLFPAHREQGDTATSIHHPLVPQLTGQRSVLSAAPSFQTHLPGDYIPKKQGPHSVYEFTVLCGNMESQKETLFLSKPSSTRETDMDTFRITSFPGSPKLGLSELGKDGGAHPLSPVVGSLPSGHSGEGNMTSQGQARELS